MKKGFTLIELLVVMSIISLLSSAVYAGIMAAKEKAYYTEALVEFREIETALELYKANNNGQVPPDADRNIPPGLEAYLAGNNWPNAPWPGSVFDWDNWQYWGDPTQPNINQISIRFCPQGAPDTSQCHFPNEPWAKHFCVDSAVYYCLSGSCRAYNMPYHNPDYPGYCVNCTVQPSGNNTTCD